MQRVAGVWRVPIGIGVGCGLVGGLVGVGQWVLALRDLAKELAAPVPPRIIPNFFNGDDAPIVMGNNRFWLGTAIVAAVAMLGLCWLAAFTSSQASQRPRASELVALLAALVSGAMYAAATPLVVATSPAPDITQTEMPMELILGLLFYTAAIFLARAGASKRARSGESLGRRAVGNDL